LYYFIDKIGCIRSINSHPNSEYDSILNELLVNLDGFKSSDGIFVMGVTNRIDLLDFVLIRPRRIYKSIYIGLPNAITCKSIINIHLQLYDSSIKIEYLVEMTQILSSKKKY